MRLMRENGMIERDEILSKVLKSGRRTYFFDVRSTKSNEYFLTITESKKFTEPDGSFHFKKHKIFLYKEDFQDFRDLLDEMIHFVNQNNSENEAVERANHELEQNDQDDTQSQRKSFGSFTDVNFDDI